MNLPFPAFRRYLSDQRRLVSAMVAAIAFQASCFVLADSTMEHLPALAYGLLVALVIFLAGLIGDFLRLQASCRAIERLRTCPDPLAAIALAQAAPDQTSEAWEGLCNDIQTAFKRVLEQEQARRTEQADFFTQWIHQIKTPLTVLRLMADTRNLDDLRPELDRIEAALQKALGFSRLNDLALDFLVRPTPLCPLCEQALAPYRPLMTSKQIALDMGGVDADSTVMADSKWLAFVLDQFISNAVKYAGPGASLRFASMIAADWPHSLPPGHRADSRLLVISDTGPGIPAEDLDRIWNRSFTGQQGRQDLSASGMGLWLARRMCQAMDIKLNLESAPGQGTRIFLGFGS